MNHRIRQKINRASVKGGATLCLRVIKGSGKQNTFEEIMANTFPNWGNYKLTELKS